MPLLSSWSEETLITTTLPCSKKECKIAYKARQDVAR